MRPVWLGNVGSSGKWLVFIQSELIERISPQAAHLGIHFFFHNTQLEMQLLEGPD